MSMGLFERLLGYEEPRISAHAFVAAMAEERRGKLVKATLQTMFRLSDQEQADAARLSDRMYGLVGLLGELKREELEDVLYIAEQGLAPYSNVDSVKTRLGI